MGHTQTSALLLYNAARELKFIRAILYINHIKMKYSSEAFFPLVQQSANMQFAFEEMSPVV